MLLVTIESAESSPGNPTAQVEALQGQTRNLDVAVRELRSQQDRLLNIKEHDAERYACAPPSPLPYRHSLDTPEQDRYPHDARDCNC